MSINAITGYSGIYTGSVQNPSVRYGMNAANNMQAFALGQTERAITSAQELKYEGKPEGDSEIFAIALEKFAKSLERDEFTPAKYRYQYSDVKQGNIDKMALLGAAYEEMGHKESVPVRTMTKMLQQGFSAFNGDKREAKALNAKVLDTNRNGKVEVDEYGTFLALADIQSKDKNSEDPSLMDGNITDEGIKGATSYLAVNTFNPITRFKLIRHMQGIFGGIQSGIDLEEDKEAFSKEIKSINFLA